MIFNPEGDTALFSQFLKGDKTAFARIYDTYFPILFQYCIRFTPDRSLIKDTLQDLFMGLLNRQKPSPEVNNIKSYLMVSSKRELLRRLARTSRLPVESMTEETYDFYLELSPENILIDKQTGERRSRQLQDTINGLTPRQREAIYLYFYNGSSYEEIAEIMNLKEVKYARTLIYRALSEIRLVLKEEGSFLGKIIS
jgi:RNA polymerase sigma factor (sigma-70 family)